IGGLELTIPVQAMVIILGFSSVPQLTIVGETGASRVEPFQNTFDMLLLLINTSFLSTIIHNHRNAHKSVFTHFYRTSDSLLSFIVFSANCAIIGNRVNNSGRVLLPPVKMKDERIVFYARKFDA